MLTEPKPAGVTIFGCGYTGRRLAARARETGLAVTALVRSKASADALAALGVACRRQDLDGPSTSLDDRDIEGRSLVYMVPPPATGVEDARAQTLLDSLPSRPHAIVYLSTSGVYGDCRGDRVFEDTPVRPETPRATRRVAAESVFRAWSAKTGVPLRILRVPGIYGPGRLPVDRIQRGVPVPQPGTTGPGNRIHVDDLARVCLAAAAYGGRFDVFNVGDGDYRDMNAYFRAVADACGLPRPPELPLSVLLEKISPAMASFLTESRLLDLTRLAEELRFSPLYPSFEAGIAASLDGPG